MDKVKLNKMRYLKVLQSLKDDYVVKLIASGLLSLWATLQNIFSTDAELVLLLVITVIIDWISGHIRAKRDKIKITSFGWRQTSVKVIEYALFMAILIGISNVFGETNTKGWVKSILAHAKNIDWFGYFYLILTELKSTAENLSGERNKFVKIITFIKEKVGLKDGE